MPLYNFLVTQPSSEVRVNDTVGVLKLTLLANSDQWEFVTPGGVRDSGTTSCH